MDGYLELIGTAKKQYQRYVEICQLCELAVDDNAPEKSWPPSLEDPSRTNEILVSLADAPVV